MLLSKTHTPSIMQTNDLIDLLGMDPFLKTPKLSAVPYAGYVAASLALSVVALFFWHGFNQSLSSWVLTDVFLLKMSWLVALVVGAAVWLWRSALPAMKIGQIHWVLVAGYVLLISQAVLQWQSEPAGDHFWSGSGSAWMCISSVFVLSLPILATVLWLIRHLAPTNWAVSGAVSGVLSGALAASVYSLRCDESSFGFFLLWYSSAILSVVPLSLLLSRRFLRW